MKNPNIEISKCFKTLSIQAAKENSRIIQQRNATESDTSTLIHHHDTAHLESLNVLWLPRNCSMLLTGTTVVISTFKRWSSISTQSAGTTWTRGKSERYFPKLMSPETEPSTSGSLKFVSWTFVSQLTFWPSVSHESDKECWLEKGSKKTQQKWKHFHQNQWPQVPEYFISFIAPSKLQKLSMNFREIQYLEKAATWGFTLQSIFVRAFIQWP